MDIKPFDLLFYKGNSLISRLIEKQTNSSYSHVAMVLDDKHVIEIDRNYNLRINHINYSSRNFDIYRLKEELEPWQKETLINYMYSILDSKYDFKEIFDIIMYKVFKIKLWNNPSKYVCSSWINDCFKTIGIILSTNDLVTPQDLISDKLYLVKKGK